MIPKDSDISEADMQMIIKECKDLIKANNDMLVGEMDRLVKYHIENRIQEIKNKQKSRIARAMQTTTLGRASYKFVSHAADRVVQAGGWVAATLLLIAG